MNTHLKSDLMRDTVLDAARKHRRKRTARGGLAILLPACVATFVMWPAQNSPVVVEASPVVEEAEPFETLSTDEELLDSLAHLGPVIVTREDGSQWLYLTKE